MESQDKLVKCSFLFLIAVLVGVVGCTVVSVLSALSFDFYCEGVRRVAGWGDVAYFFTIDLEQNYRYFQSGDGGAEWYLTDVIPPEVEGDLALRHIPLPMEICDPDDGAVCYRFSAGSSPIQESLDGGTSWQAVDLPFRIKSKGGCAEPVVTDAAFAREWEGASFLMVGMGTGGVVWRSGRGEWQYVELDVDELHYSLQEGR